MAARNLHGHRQIAEEAHAMVNTARKEKTPRPPNAFILYRQRHHPLYKDAFPHLHNNDICKLSFLSLPAWTNELSAVILGKQWTEESKEVKDQYKMAAEEIKEQHLRDHPEYQYRPRKPAEKKRRMTKRKAAALAAQSTKENGQQEIFMDKETSPVDAPKLDLVSTNTRDPTSPLGETKRATESLSNAVPYDKQGAANDEVCREYPPPKMEFTSEANAVLTLGDDSALPSDFALLMEDFNANADHTQGPTINAVTAFQSPVLFDNPTKDAQDGYNFYTSVEDHSNFPKVADKFDTDAAHATCDNVLSTIPENDVYDEDLFAFGEVEFHRILNERAKGIGHP